MSFGSDKRGKPLKKKTTVLFVSAKWFIFNGLNLKFIKRLAISELQNFSLTKHNMFIFIFDFKLRNDYRRSFRRSEL